jgi:C1A family cysteine protease
MRKLRSLVCFVIVGGIAACATAPDESVSSQDAVTADDGPVTLDDVQQAIKARHASWTAGSTSVSGLPATERSLRLGLPASEIALDRTRVIEPLDAELAPETFDWRNVEGKNFVSPVLDQGRCGSCVAFSAVATFETQLNVSAGDTTSPWQLSPQYVFSCGGGACSFGWYPASAAKFLVSKGTPDQACMPYASGAHGDDTKCQAACSDVSSRAMKARAFTTPSKGALAVNAVKEALKKGPLMTSMTVYDDFMYYTGGIYKHVTGGVAGGHAVSIVGFSDEHESWIVRNSWGTGWGDKGFFEIAWEDDSGLGESTWGFDVPAPGPFIAIADLRDGALLSGNYSLKFQGESIAAPITWKLQRPSGETFEGNVATTVSAVLDTKTVPDGVYTLSARSGTLQSPPHTVYILNGAETGNIRFKTLTNGATLKGTAMFDVTIAASPVPATLVTWTVKNAAGEVIVTRSTENTGPLMQLGWNTKRWPNGDYTIGITGGVGTQSLDGASVNVKVKN